MCGTGSVFLPGALVTISVVDDALTQLNFQQDAGGSGQIDFGQRIPCISGLTLHSSITDSRSNPGGLTGVLWSNTFNTSCP